MNHDTIVIQVIDERGRPLILLGSCSRGWLSASNRVQVLEAASRITIPPPSITHRHLITSKSQWHVRGAQFWQVLKADVAGRFELPLGSGNIPRSVPSTAYRARLHIERAGRRRPIKYNVNYTCVVFLINHYLRIEQTDFTIKLPLGDHINICTTWPNSAFLRINWI